MSRYTQRLEQALALAGYGEDTRHRLNKLYADARAEWLTRNCVSTDLHELLNVLLREATEVDAGDDAQIRAAYEIRGAA